MDHWRRFFRTAEADIFDVIEKAIVVAALDCPKEFRRRRDGIAEKLFSVEVSRCFGCNNVELLVPDAGEDLGVEEDGGSVKYWELIDSANNGCEQDELTEVTKEVLRIKEVLLHSHDQSEAVLYESLRQLQLIQISVESLKATEIGRTVNVLRKHNSKRIGRLARTLIQGWKDIVDHWILTAPAIPEHYPNSADPSLLAEEDGLPTPPMDEGTLLAIQSSSIQLSEIFDGIDDNGNFQASVDTLQPVQESRGPARWLEPPRQPVVPWQTKPHFAPVAPPKPQGIVSNFAKPFIADSGPSRPPLRTIYEQKPNGQSFAVQRLSSNIPVDKSKDDEEALFRAKLELAKRKLHEGYEKAENAKRQRTIQIVDFLAPPKQPERQRGKPKSQRGKLKSQGRNWVNAQR